MHTMDFVSSVITRHVSVIGFIIFSCHSNYLACLVMLLIPMMRGI